ncbi:retron Ec67 family RNA-directed DNA polymerase/endonuclease [Sulfitobacter dubius]|uniref:retron Ec67 family RNA-directed DNA polymerase/endonuclease n=1 Tax=Sulfitobacter dubius TaxID=218673 RepID=UPI0008E9150B|nr:retron Ec67 family RNA-directed DNA polymerase/endonuclease [Sulfitobacter dubius]SFG54383.1 Reverse transcriptase (RNA-dependent DNA polymerase) [Sulfitobacter dubius]
MSIYRYGIKDLKGCADLGDLARLLEVQPKFLSKQIYHVDDADKYHVFPIPKKNGSLRQIHAPNSNLKFIQSRLSRLLYQCYFDLHGKPKNLSKVLSHGFQRDRDLSIFTNANRHTNKRYVFNADIDNFFPSFNFGRVRGYFIKNEHFKLTETVATVIAQTACFQNSLPQGAPSSPIITEFITQVLDYRLQSIAKRNRCTYSRYADDLTFSTNLGEFPSKIGYPFPLPEVWVAGPGLERAIAKSGFKLNEKKIRMQHAQQRQATTNLTVNQKVNVGSYYYKGVRLCANAMMRHGAAVRPKKAIEPGTPLTANQILGMLAHVHDIKGRELEHKALRKYGKFQPAPHYLRLMGDFYHYKRIHINPRPIVICEGKTDYIYLKEAIRWNVADPRVSSRLVDPVRLLAPTGKGDQWLIDFLKHTKTADNFLGLAGGGGDLKNFVNIHLGRIKIFHDNPLLQPVIIVVDNDSQSTEMWSTIKKASGSTNKIDGSEPFYHVAKNLYVVPIPSGGKSNFYIEKLFDDSWLKEDLNGRTFKVLQRKDEKLKDTEYGKGEFADKVIRANRGKVDCSSFLPLLHTICDIIDK